MLAGAAWAAWSITTSAWLFGGTPAAFAHEVARCGDGGGTERGTKHWAGGGLRSLPCSLGWHILACTSGPSTARPCYRLLVQLGAALGLLRWVTLPLPWGPQLARLAAVLSLVSLAFLSTQTAGLRATGGKAGAIGGTAGMQPHKGEEDKKAT